MPMMRRVIAARLRSHRKYLQPECDAAINALPLGARGSGVFHANSGSRIYMRGGCLLSILPNPSKKPSVTVNGTRDLATLLTHRMSPFVQTGRHVESLAQEVQRVKGFSLRVADGRDRREGDWRGESRTPRNTAGRTAAARGRASCRLGWWACGRAAGGS
ncbi:hypothetical protein ACKVWM_010523 [Pyricularia oryzae]